MQKIFFGKRLFEYKFQFAVEKKNKENFSKLQGKKCCRCEQNTIHTISIYKNYMISTF